MARPKSDHILNVEDNDQPEEDELSPQERQRLTMAMSNPVGETARRMLEEGDGELVTLRGTRRERTFSHRVDTEKGTAFFWEGKARVTPELKEALLQYNYILTA